MLLKCAVQNWFPSSVHWLLNTRSTLTKGMFQDMFVPDEHYYSTLGKIVSMEMLEEGQMTVVQDLKKDTLYGQCTRTSLWGYTGMVTIKF